MEETTALTLHGFGCCRRAKANLFICHERERERERERDDEKEAEETCNVPLAMWKHGRKSAAGDVLPSAKMRLVLPFPLPMIRYHLLPQSFSPFHISFFWCCFLLIRWYPIYPHDLFLVKGVCVRGSKRARGREGAKERASKRLTNKWWIQPWNLSKGTREDREVKQISQVFLPRPWCSKAASACLFDKTKQLCQWICRCSWIYYHHSP